MKNKDNEDKSEAITITQEKDIVLSLIGSSTIENISFDQSVQTITVRANVKPTFNIVGGWITKQDDTNDITLGEKEFKFDVTANPTSDVRNGIITISAVGVEPIEVTLSQIANPVPLPVQFTCPNLKAAILAHSDGADSKWDANGDGELSLEEAAKVIKVELGNKSISSLVGLEACTSLTHLQVYDNSTLTTVDLSNFPVTLGTVYLYQNGLTSLTGFEHLVNLAEFTCHTNNLKGVIDISSLNKLKRFECYKNNNKEVHGNGTIEDRAKGINNIIFPNPSSLTQMHIGSTFTTEPLDLSGLTKLTQLVCSDTYLKGLDLTHCTSLNTVDLSTMRNVPDGYVQDLSKNLMLTNINISNNGRLATLDLSKHTELTLVNIRVTGISVLDISKSPNLSTVIMDGTPNLTEVQVHSAAHVTLKAGQFDEGDKLVR